MRIAFLSQLLVIKFIHTNNLACRAAGGAEHSSDRADYDNNENIFTLYILLT